MPDRDLVVPGRPGPVRLFELLHDGRPVLVDLRGVDAPALPTWATQVRHVPARDTGTWELPVLGTVAPPTAVLVRPDGYVAWVGEGDGGGGDESSGGLEGALARWFAGGPAAPVPATTGAQRRR